MEYEAEGKVTVSGSSGVTCSAYTYASTGGLSFSGCVDFEITQYIAANFKERDVAYEARLAKKGTLDRLVIKKIIPVLNAYGRYQINYLDTFNAVYLEEELVDHETAIELATAYFELQQARAIEALQNSCG